MPSRALDRWKRAGRAELDEIEAAHTAIGGSGRGRRFATKQINHAFAVLLSSQFQGFCRDLHTESVDYVASRMEPGPLQSVVRNTLMAGRQLDRGNVQPSSLGADFGRLGMEFWRQVEAAGQRNAIRKAHLDRLNRWRNAIAHQDFQEPGVRGVALHLPEIRQWRRSCDRLAAVFDRVLADHLQALVGHRPWA